MRALLLRPAIVAAMLLGLMGTLLSEGGTQSGKGLVTTERNSRSSDFVYRLGLVSTAGTDAKTGAFFIKIYRLPQGSECDTGGASCKGVDLIVSIASLDLGGDNALYRITGLANWDFVGWKGYAEYDAPEYSTSFTVKVSMKPGKTLSECQSGPSRSGDRVTFSVNPWKLTCEMSK